MLGYNNNHAGMHMIWYRRYAAYDDLDYYDRLAEKKRSEKKTMVPHPTVSVTKIDGGQQQRKEVDNRMSQTNEKAETEQKQKKKPTKHKKQRDLQFPQRPAYGTERVISVDSFIGMDIVSRNLMLMALKRKIDIKRVLLETEDMMKKDERTNPEPSRYNSWSWLPRIEKSVIFLNILAEKLDCSLAEFFIDDERTRKTFLYKFLTSIDDEDWITGEIDPETGRTYICINNYGMLFKEYGYQYSDPMGFYSHIMDLVLEKEPQDDGSFWYSLEYGSLTLRPETSYEYSTMGAYLWEEGEGKLKDYIEALIAKHPEWIDTDDD